MIWIEETCIHCGACKQYCPEHAIESSGGKMRIVQERCSGCGKCVKACYMRAIRRGEPGQAPERAFT